MRRGHTHLLLTDDIAVYFLNATDQGDKITMELPLSDEEASPS